METIPQFLLVVMSLLAAGSIAIWARLIPKMLRREPLVEPEPRPSVAWTGPDVLMAFVIWILLQSGLSSVNGLQRELDQLQFPDRWMAVNALASLGALAIMLMFLRARSATWAELGFETKQLGYDLRLGALAFVAAALPVYGTLILLANWFTYEHPITRMIKEHPELRTLALATWTAVVIAPLIEEFFFRVLFQGWLESRAEGLRSRGRYGEAFAEYAPIAVSSFVFAAVHIGNGPDFLPLFELSLILGYLYRQTHRIYAPLIAHMCLNGTTMLILWCEVWGKIA